MQDFTKTNDNACMGNFFDWIHAKYGESFCLGQRRLLGCRDGFYQGKKVRKISQGEQFQHFTHKEVKALSEDIGRGMLAGYNIKKGDRVLIYAKTRMDWMICAMASWRVGAIITTLYTTSTDLAIRFVLEQTKPKLIFTESDFLAKVVSIKQDLVALKTCAVVSMDSDYQSTSCNLLESLLTVRQRGKLSEDGVTFPEVEADDLALIMYTSGTSSNPKGVMITHRQILCGITACVFNVEHAYCKFPPGSFLLVHLKIMAFFWNSIPPTNAMGCP